MDLNINELDRVVQLMNEDDTRSAARDAKVNMLKYFQIERVREYEEAYDILFYELKKEGRLECLRGIALNLPKDLLQPKTFELQECDEDAQLAKQIDFYLDEARLAKKHLDHVVSDAVGDSEACKVLRAEVKTPESTERKVRKFCGGNVQKVTDMARIAVICGTPEDLKKVYLALMESLQEENVFRVANGFKSDWMPSGYRDVKLNPIVKDHLCEIQLHLSNFWSLKKGQHEVYKWARDLNVTTEMHPMDLFKNLSSEVMKEMIHLAEKDWKDTGCLLPDLQLIAGRYAKAEEGFKNQLSKIEGRDFGNEDSKESRGALLDETKARARLGQALEEQGKYDEARLLFDTTQKNLQRALGRDHPRVAEALSHLAGMMHDLDMYPEADSMYLQAIEILKKTLPGDHPSLATVFNNRAELLQSQGKYAEAEALYKDASTIHEKTYGVDSLPVAKDLVNMATLLEIQELYDEAGPSYEKSLVIHEKVLGPNHPALATVLNNWAGLLETQGYHEAADEKYVRAIEIGEKALDRNNPDLAVWLNNRAGLLQTQSKYDEAERLYRRSLAMREIALGKNHRYVAQSLNNLAELLREQKKFEEAEPMYEDAIKMYKRILGPDDPEVASVYNNLALLLSDQGQDEKAEELYRASLAIDKVFYGPHRLEVATDLHNLASCLVDQKRCAEAMPLVKEALEIRMDKLGNDHEDTLESQDLLDSCRAL